MIATGRDRHMFWGGVMHIAYGAACLAVCIWVPGPLWLRITGYALTGFMFLFGAAGIADS